MLQFVDRHRLMGQGLGWIDLHLLASALVSHATLATRDVRLARAARDLGVARPAAAEIRRRRRAAAVSFRVRLASSGLAKSGGGQTQGTLSR